MAYVGNAARDQRVNNGAINGRPYGYAYQPSSLDPTNVSGGQAQPLPDDLLRPYQGYGSITQRTFDGYSDYNALQVVHEPPPHGGRPVVRRGLHLLGRAKNLGAIDPFVSDNRARNYTLNGSRPHNLVINYSYEIPNLSQKWNNIFVKALADNWQVSGITSILSGTKQGFSYAYTGVPTGVLSGTGAINGGDSRPDIVCDPNISRGDRSFDVQFDTSCIRPPSDPNRLGNAIGDEYQGPGFMNWDFSFFKVRADGRNPPAAVPHRAVQRVRHRSVDRDRHERDLQLRTGVQTDANFGKLTGCDAERAPHPARREVQVLSQRIT